MRFHAHKYRFESDMEHCHTHRIVGFTENMFGVNSFHFHSFYGISAYSNHTHYYSGFTGFPVKTENGHRHKIEGILEINNMHEHKFNNYTYEDIEYISGKSVQGAMS